MEKALEKSKLILFKVVQVGTAKGVQDAPIFKIYFAKVFQDVSFWNNQATITWNTKCFN